MTTPVRIVLAWCLCLAACHPTSAATPVAGGDCCAATPADVVVAERPESDPLRIPNTPVVDQFGDERQFYDDLMAGHTTVVSFIFTTCKTICPPLTATLRQVQIELGERVGRDIALVSVSVDPTTDVPERLKTFADTFGVEPGWSFVTGDKQPVDHLLQALGAFSEDKTDHTPMILVHNDRTGQWTRVYGLAPAATLVKAILEVAGKEPVESDTPAADTPTADTPAGQLEQARAYFPNVELFTHEGRAVHFFDDFFEDRVVVLHFMFASCTGICPPTMANLLTVQEYLGDVMEKEVVFLSVSVDPAADTVEVLRRYAAEYEIGPGWYMLTGSQENVLEVTRKLGGFQRNKIDHSTMLVIGSAASGEWTKLLATAPADTITDEVRSLLDTDRS